MTKLLFDHFVVLMLENWSFDHLFGYLGKGDGLPKGARPCSSSCSMSRAATMITWRRRRPYRPTVLRAARTSHFWCHSISSDSGFVSRQS
jgi:phospholipase C